MVPRYHTNMVGWVESLMSQNVDVRVVACRREFSENHTHIKPLILPTNTSKMLTLVPLTKKLKSKLMAPKLSKIFNEVRKIQADIIVVRFELDLTSIKYLFVARLEGTPVYIYTQWPVTKTPILKKMLVFFFLHLFKMQTFSPVYEYGHSKLDFDSVEKASRNDFDLNMKAKQLDRQLIHWIPFTLSERFTAKQNRHVEENNQSAFQFVTIGKLVERKNILMIAEVFSKNQRFTNSNSQLIIIGECTTLEHRLLLQKLDQLLRSCGASNKIKVLRNLNHEEVQEILRNSQVFLLQSIKEPASISILEAMGNANVLILNPTSGTASYAGDNYGSFASSTQLELDECIDKVLTDKALVKRMQIRNEGIFNDYFSNRIVGFQLYNFLFQDIVYDSKS
jgi:glycosyltransferase involved in cell wall biosynthesis